MYNVILWKDNGNEDIHVFEKKPTFKELYPLIGCSTIQIVAGYTDEHKTFEMYIDEEGKYNPLAYPNKRATNAWYEWQKRTKRMCLPGDHIAGNAAIIKNIGKIKSVKKEKVNESN